TVFTAIPAAWSWQPVAMADWPLLIAIGVLAQIGQYCFLRAYQSAPANKLAPFGYLSIVLATLAGFLAFGEVPQWTTIIGIVVIIGALVATERLDHHHLRRKKIAHVRELWCCGDRTGRQGERGALPIGQGPGPGGGHRPIRPR